MAKKTFKDAVNPAEYFISNSSEIQTKDAKEQKQITTAPEGYHINPFYIENKSKRLQLLVKPSTANKLKAKARELDTSVNDIINTILEEALKED